jgi:hypothetical protein
MSRLAVQRSIFAAALVAAVPCLPPLTPGTLRADEKAPGTATLQVQMTRRYSDYVLVELHQDGKLLRTRELEYREAIFAPSIDFAKLAPGLYEVHFTGAGYKKCIKRIAIGKEDKEVMVYVELDQKEERVVGGGPSLQELEKRIAELEKANADLKAEIEKLKKK